VPRRTVRAAAGGESPASPPPARVHHATRHAPLRPLLLCEDYHWLRSMYP